MDGEVSDILALLDESADRELSMDEEIIRKRVLVEDLQSYGCGGTNIVQLERDLLVKLWVGVVIDYLRLLDLSVQLNLHITVGLVEFAGGEEFTLLHIEHKFS